jgi:hypothetical protein
MSRSERRRKGRSNPDSIGNDLSFGDRTDRVEVVESRADVLQHALLIGMSSEAGSITPIVKGEDVDAELMKLIESCGGVGECTVTLT